MIWDTSHAGFDVIDLDEAVATFNAGVADGYYPPVLTGLTGGLYQREHLGHVTAMRHDGTRLYATVDPEWSCAVDLTTSRVCEVAIVPHETIPREKA